MEQCRMRARRVPQPVLRQRVPGRKVPGRLPWLKSCMVEPRCHRSGSGRGRPLRNTDESGQRVSVLLGRLPDSNCLVAGVQKGVVPGGDRLGSLGLNDPGPLTLAASHQSTHDFPIVRSCVGFAIPVWTCFLQPSRDFVNQMDKFLRMPFLAPHRAVVVIPALLRGRIKEWPND